MYGEAAHPGLVQAMRDIEVTPIPERIGHYLTDDLITRMNGSGQTPPPKYRLSVKLSQSTKTPTIESQIQTADAATVTGTAMFALTKIDGEILYAGAATNGGLRPHVCRATPTCAPRATPKYASPNRSPTKSNCASRPL